MFTRFKATPSRLQVSLREIRRIAGKVISEHIASLGTVALPLTVAGRVTFWTGLHERLTKLGNRVGGEDQGKILGAVHARIPMVTVEEREAERQRQIEAEVVAWQQIEDGYGRINASEEKRITKCHEEISMHRENMGILRPVKEGLAAAADQPASRWRPATAPPRERSPARDSSSLDRLELLARRLKA
jgi:hypothetical protein